MQSCCWENFTANREKEHKLKGFRGPQFQQQQPEPEHQQQQCMYTQQDYQNEEMEEVIEDSLRLKLWRVFDDKYSSTTARVSLLFVPFLD